MFPFHGDTLIYYFKITASFLFLFSHILETSDNLNTTFHLVCFCNERGLVLWGLWPSMSRKVPRRDSWFQTTPTPPSKIITTTICLEWKIYVGTTVSCVNRKYSSNTSSVPSKQLLFLYRYAKRSCLNGTSYVTIHSLILACHITRRILRVLKQDVELYFSSDITPGNIINKPLNSCILVLMNISLVHHNCCRKRDAFVPVQWWTVPIAMLWFIAPQ